MEIIAVESDQVDEEARRALRMLWNRAFAERFTADDEAHAYGGVHVLARDGGLVGHASAVPRRIRFGDGAWVDVGYVEAVATDPGHSRPDARPASTSVWGGSGGLGSRTRRP